MPVKLISKISTHDGRTLTFVGLARGSKARWLEAFATTIMRASHLYERRDGI
jgi:hypothetical protein